MASRTKQPATPRTAAEHLSRQTDSGTSSADGYLTSSDGQWTAKIWYPGDPESTFSGKVDGKDYSCKGLDIMDSTADYDKWWEEQADQETLTAAASLWPVKVRLDDVMVYIAIRMFSATERAKRFPADFDNNGNIRTTRPHFGGGCRVQTRTGCQFYIIYKGYYCLTGVDVPDVAHSAMGLGTMTHGRATFRDSTSLSFGRVALTRLSSDKVGFVLYRYTAGPKEIPFPKSPQPEDTPADTLEHQLGMRPIMMAPWTSTANREIFDAGARAEQMTEETWFRLENMDVSNPLHKLDEILAERQHRRSQLSAANTDQDSSEPGGETPKPLPARRTRWQPKTKAKSNATPPEKAKPTPRTASTQVAEEGAQNLAGAGDSGPPTKRLRVQDVSAAASNTGSEMGFSAAASNTGSEMGSAIEKQPATMAEILRAPWIDIIAMAAAFRGIPVDGKEMATLRAMLQDQPAATALPLFAQQPQLQLQPSMPPQPAQSPMPLQSSPMQLQLLPMPLQSSPMPLQPAQSPMPLQSSPMQLQLLPMPLQPAQPAMPLQPVRYGQSMFRQDYRQQDMGLQDGLSPLQTYPQTGYTQQDTWAAKAERLMAELQELRRQRGGPWH